MTAEKTVERFPSGVIMPPPSKSVSHRALICAALAGGESAMERVLGVGVSDDIAATRAALSNLLHAGMAEERSPMGSADKQDAPGIFAGRSKSAEVEGTLSTDRVDQDGAQVIAAGRSALLASEETVRVIDAAESGSTLRFILPIAAAIGGKWRFRGRGRLMSRPMDAYEKVFPAHGCRLDTFPDKNEIHLEGRLNHGNFEIPGNISSQFISGLLLALPLLDGDSAIRLSAPLESADYVHMTIDVMRAFGVVVDTMGNGDWRIRGGQRYHAVDFRIEKDWSQAAFFLGAAALGCDVSIAGLSMDSLQGDKRILDILRAMGAEIIEAMCPGLPINRSDRMDNAGNMNNAGNMDDIDCMDNIHSTDGTGGMKEVGHRANTDVIPVLRVVPSADGLKATCPRYRIWFRRLPFWPVLRKEPVA